MVTTCIPEANRLTISAHYPFRKKWASILHKSFLTPSYELLNFEHSLYLPPAVALLSLTSCVPQANNDSQTFIGSHVPHSPSCLLKNVLPKSLFILALTHNFSALVSCQALCSGLFYIFSYLAYPTYSSQWPYHLGGFNVELYFTGEKWDLGGWMTCPTSLD